MTVLGSNNSKMSNGSQKQGTCIYCGYEGFITRDHIPPQCFFPKPKPSNLITVPCCKKCHTKWSNDDEYFRAVIVSAVSVYDDPNAQKVNQALLRSMKKPNKKGFSSMIRQSLAEVEVNTPSGIYLGKTPAMKIEKNDLMQSPNVFFRVYIFMKKTTMYLKAMKYIFIFLNLHQTVILWKYLKQVDGVSRK